MECEHEEKYQIRVSLIQNNFAMWCSRCGAFKKDIFSDWEDCFFLSMAVEEKRLESECPHGKDSKNACDVCSGRGIWEMKEKEPSISEVIECMKGEFEDYDRED